ncbi:MAG: hypothetical protein HOP15_00885, partial [Planctomycetes bacterium]|nr:hypothetical protein [Planctomycetota bacterium]
LRPAEIAPLVEDSSSERVREERPQSHEDTPSEARERVDRGPIQIDEEEQRWLERNPDH